MFDGRTLEAALDDVGSLLAARGQRAELAIIGGGALLLLGLGVRPTEDCDVVGVVEDAGLRSGEPLPEAVATAAREVARARNLAEDWINAGPASLMQLGLPDGFMERAHRREYGALTLLLASRLDQIHFKLYATSSPRDKHAADLRTLHPTRAELEQAAAWAHAGSAGGFSDEIAEALAHFAALADGDG